MGPRGTNEGVYLAEGEGVSISLVSTKGHVSIGPFLRNIHFYLPNITPVATKVHVIVRRSVVLTRMCDNKELLSSI